MMTVGPQLLVARRVLAEEVETANVVATDPLCTHGVIPCAACANTGGAHAETSSNAARSMRIILCLLRIGRWLNEKICEHLVDFNYLRQQPVGYHHRAELDLSELFLAESAGFFF